MSTLLALMLASSPASAQDGAAFPDDASDLPELGLLQPITLGDAPIINGEPATKDDFPMAGGMIVAGTIEVYGFELEGKILMCTSTLIAPDVVLLAAHCVDLEAVLGLQGMAINDPQFAWSRKADLTDYQLTNEAIVNPPDWPSDVVLAREVVAHEDFNILGMGLGLSENSDIALMFLEEPVLDVPYAFLPTKEEDDQLAVGMEVDVVGWGQQSADPYAPGSVGEKIMGTSFIAEVAPYEMKIGDAVDDVRKCHGDSGGPTFAYVETTSTESMRVVGVTSHSYDLTDCNLTGGVDTRAAHYLDWIDEEMTKRCEDGSRVWCEVPGIVPPPDENGLMPWEAALLAENEEDEKAGCGCANTGAGTSVGWFALALAGFAARRRRA